MPLTAHSTDADATEDASTTSSAEDESDSASEDEPVPAPAGEVSSGVEEGRSRLDEPMPTEEACRILRVPLDADWETIEKSRREIVQKSHPDRLNFLSPEKWKAVLENARRANDATQALLNSRCRKC